MARLNWTLESRHDLKNIFDYISMDSKYYASIQIRRIKEKAALLKESPRLGRIVPEIQEENIRELIFGNYRIIYRIVNIDRIDILTIYHSARILRNPIQ
jgi:toxin ParE1/3/4